MRRAPYPYGLALLSLVAACGNDDGQIADAGLSFTDGGKGACDLEPRYSTIHDEIFNTPTCNTPNCHGIPFKGGLALAVSAASAHASLIGATVHPIDKIEYPGRVVASDPLQSFLWVKLVTQKTTERMPLGQAPLDECQLNTIEDWITAGAAND